MRKTGAKVMGKGHKKGTRRAQNRTKRAQIRTKGHIKGTKRAQNKCVVLFKILIL